LEIYNLLDQAINGEEEEDQEEEELFPPSSYAKL
jgi:hypothetical protein